MALRTRTRPAGPPAQQVRPRPHSIGRGTSPAAEAVSDALRRFDDPLLTSRRRVAGLSLVATGALGVVALYQYGLLRRVPEPPLPFLDADSVDATGSAYLLLHTPDAALGMASYAATLALAGMGAADRHVTAPWLPLLLAGKVALDAVSSGFLTAEQLSGHRKLCSWCTTAAAASLLSVPAVLPEARAAWRVLRRRG